MEKVSTTADASRGTQLEVAKSFLRLGFVAYGGPAAHVAMMEEDFVRRHAWVTRERFLDLVGAVSLLPGPSSTELAIYLGEIRAGLAGLIVAGICFTLPAAVLVAILAWAYLKFGTLPQVGGLLFGIKPVVVALVAQAVWNLGKTALRNLPLIALAIVVIALAILRVNTVLLLLGAGSLWLILREGAALATVGMFLPAFVYVAGTSGFLPRLRKSPLAGAFPDGVNAAAVALMAYVGWQFGRAALVNLPAVILAAISVVLVFRYKFNSTWLILGGAAAGIAFRFLGWS